MIFKISQVNIQIQQNYLWYASSVGDATDGQVCGFLVYFILIKIKLLIILYA
jgi:hypothetical protein